MPSTEVKGSRKMCMQILVVGPRLPISRLTLELRLTQETKVRRSRNTRRAMRILWTLDNSVQCYRTAPILLSSNTKTFDRIQISVLWKQVGRFFGDIAPERWQMSLGLTLRSFVMPKRLVTSIIFYASCELLMLHPSLVVVISGFSTIRS